MIREQCDRVPVPHHLSDVALVLLRVRNLGDEVDHTPFVVFWFPFHASRKENEAFQRDRRNDSIKWEKKKDCTTRQLLISRRNVFRWHN